MSDYVPLVVDGHPRIMIPLHAALTCQLSVEIFLLVPSSVHCRKPHYGLILAVELPKMPLDTVAIKRQARQSWQCYLDWYILRQILTGFSRPCWEGSILSDITDVILSYTTSLAPDKFMRSHRTGPYHLAAMTKVNKKLNAYVCKLRGMKRKIHLLRIVNLGVMIVTTWSYQDLDPRALYYSTVLRSFDRCHEGRILAMLLVTKNDTQSFWLMRNLLSLQITLGRAVSIK